MKKARNIYREVLFGVAVGDAVGVPYEFRDRNSIAKQPATDMRGYGTYNLPPGTWSDDSSLTFCLAEALTHGFSLESIAENFKKWLYENYWTPYGNVFDAGITTREAIYRLKTGCQPENAGGMYEDENGNGSLMRILPLLFYTHNLQTGERYKFAKQVSSITHAHIRSVIACFYYLEFARCLLDSTDKFSVYKQLQSWVPDFLKTNNINEKEIEIFHRLLKDDISLLAPDEIYSSGYVLHSLEASVWCILTTNNYKDAVLKAVNLGSDTDTTAAITGGLAALLYGYENIPAKWVAQLARRVDIDELAFRCEIAFKAAEM
jgi:ADP-ribosylglycohydrolase